MKIECPIHALRDSDAVAIVDQGRELTYRELDALAAEAAKSIGAGNRIAMTPECDTESIVKLVAIWRAGSTACLLNKWFPKQKREAFCKLVGATADPDSVGTPSTMLSGDATIMFSSGSTGEPKAALHSIANHYYSALGANANMPLGPGDIWSLNLPLYHVGGLAILWRCFLAGATVAMPWATDSYTHVSVVPTQLPDLIALPPEELKAVLLGGAELPPSLCRRAIEAGLPLYTTYGCTEMSSQVTTGRSPDNAGQVLDHRELKIGDDGEILLRGKTLFRGYVTADSLDSARDEEGWFHSGDIGKLIDGELRVIGRMDNMFISGGENIQPETIERCLLDMDEVEGAVVVPIPNERYGKRPVAFVRSSLTEQELADQLKSCLPSFMIPDAFLELPKAEGLKVSRPALEKIAWKRFPRATSRNENPD